MAKDFTVTVCDFETGGLVKNGTGQQSADKYQITEVGMLNFDLRTGVVNWEYQAFIKPYGDLEINAEVYDVTQVTPEDILNGKDYKTVVADMIKLLKKGKRGYNKTSMMGHNFTVFDMPFMVKIFQLAGKDVNEFIGTTIDTLPLSQARWIEEESHTLGDCCKRIGYTLLGAHGAMNDVRGNFELGKYLLFSNESDNDSIEIKTAQAGTGKHRKYFNF